MIKKDSDVESLFLNTLKGNILLFFVTSGVLALGFFLYAFIVKLWATLSVYIDISEFLSYNFQNPLSAFFGIAAFFLHLIGYYNYGLEVLNSNIRPNVATWTMWLFGGVVELVTYDAILGSHWSATALPFACTLGILWVCVSIGIAQYRNKKNGGGIIYHPPVRSDYALLAFDSFAGGLWILGYSPILANIVAVSTTIATFIPIWRTTYDDSYSEDPGPWLYWSVAYLMMAGSVLTGSSNNEIGLYFLPLYYFMLHAIVMTLALRNKPLRTIIQTASTNLMERLG